MLHLLERVFSWHGDHVLPAADGKQALELYRCHKPRIAAVLLDIRIPKIGGEEVFHR
jgi:CheY-like chemotaxis protein